MAETLAQARRRIAGELARGLSFVVRSHFPASIHVEYTEGDVFDRIESTLSEYAALAVSARAAELREQFGTLPTMLAWRIAEAVQEFKPYPDTDTVFVEKSRVLSLLPAPSQETCPEVPHE